MAERSFWSGIITFGLVSIPVRFFAANRESRVPLRMLAPDGAPLRRRYYNPETGRDLENEDIVRGYEIEKGRHIVVENEELERLAPEKTRDIDLRRFVPAAAIPPRYFERAYFLAPAGPSVRAYRLLAETMEQTARAGIATFVMRGKEYLVALLSERGILRAETLRFADEIRSAADVGLPEKPRVPAAAVRRFRDAIRRNGSNEIAPEEMRDVRAEKLRELAESKRARGKDVRRSGAGGEEEPALDILAILKRSLAGKASGDGGSRPDLAGLSKAQLYDRAKALDVPGRSAMSKAAATRSGPGIVFVAALRRPLREGGVRE